MKCFELTQEVLKRGWGDVGQYWFSLNSYKVVDVTDFAALDHPDGMSQSEYFLSLGYIPFFEVGNEEVLRAFADSLENKKLKSVISKLDAENFTESFWKYFNAYPQMTKEWENFEDKYILSKAIEWCEQNKIDYSVPKN